jgi:adenosylcobinamide-GDP ribazoletransferase
LKPALNNFFNGILYGISYFTVLPVKLQKYEADNNFYKGVVFALPIAGLLLGSVSLLFFLLLPFPALYNAVLISILYLFFYGFLHLEAAADTIDGYFASLSSKDVYRVMKEPQVGALGAIGTFCLILLKILALSYLFYSEAYSVILLSIMLSRTTLWFALEHDFHPQSRFIHSMKSAFVLPVLCRLFLKLLLFPLFLLTRLILKRIKKQLGFINGDSLGFTIETVEILLLHLGVLFVST